MHAMQPLPAFPLFICGLPRSGTSFLFAVLSTHPAFANDNFKDKELRYFEKFLGNRPWGGIDAVSQKKFAGIDAHIIPDIVRTLHERLKVLRGGPRGHYLNANPRDIFYSEIIHAAVPEAKFLITLRDPLTNVWSALNYPTHSWGKRDEASGFFREDDIRRTADHWNKVAAHILRFKLHDRPRSCFILEQETLAAASHQFHETLENFLGLAGVASLLDAKSGTIIHSSFVESVDGVGHDRQFSNIRDKIAHFQTTQRMFSEDGRYVSMVLDICGTFVQRLAEIGLMQLGPSLRLLSSHARKNADSGAPDFHAKLYAFTTEYLLQKILTPDNPSYVLVLGLPINPTEDPLGAYLASTPGIRALVLESNPMRAEAFRTHFSHAPGIEIRHSPLATASATPPSGSDDHLDLEEILAHHEFRDPTVLQIDAGIRTTDMLMAQNFIALRPKLILMPHVEPSIGHDYRARNVFTNLGYQCLCLGNACIAIRRDCLDAPLAEELRLFEATSTNA